MAIIRHSTGLRNAILDAGLGPAFDGGSGRIAIYAGAVPAAGGDAISNTLLGTLTLASDAFAAAASGAAALNSVTSDTSADNNGSPGFAVFYRTGDTVLSSAAGASDRRLILDISATYLTADPGSGGTTLNVGDTASFPSSGTLVCESEEITYTGKTGTTFTGCTRGANSTTAAAHAIDKTVRLKDAALSIDNGKIVAGGTIAVGSMSYTYPS